MCEVTDRIEKTPKLMAELVTTWSKMSRLLRRVEDLHDTLSREQKDAPTVTHA